MKFFAENAPSPFRPFRVRKMKQNIAYESALTTISDLIDRISHSKEAGKMTGENRPSPNHQQLHDFFALSWVDACQKIFLFKNSKKALSNSMSSIISKTLTLSRLL